MKYLKYPLSIIIIIFLFYTTGLGKYYQQITKLQDENTNYYSLDIGPRSEGVINFNYPIGNYNLTWYSDYDILKSHLILEDKISMSIQLYQTHLDASFYSEQGEELFIYISSDPKQASIYYTDPTIYCNEQGIKEPSQDFFEQCNTTFELEKYYNLVKEIQKQQSQILEKQKSELKKK